MENLFCSPSQLEEDLDKKVTQMTKQKQEQQFDPTSFDYGHHDPAFKEPLQKIINNRIGAFSKHDHDFGQAKIRLPDGTMSTMFCPITFKAGAPRQFSAKYRPIPRHFVNSVNTILSDMVKAEVVMKTPISKALHQVLFIKKKNDDITPETSEGEDFTPGALLSDEAQLKYHHGFNIRVVINLINLNKSSVPLQSMLTPIRYMFSTLAGAKVISVLDQRYILHFIIIQYSVLSSFIIGKLFGRYLCGRRTARTWHFR